MGNWRDFPLPDGSYSDDTRPWTQQDVCNYLPTFAEGEGTRSRLKLATAPGLRLHAVVGTGPHRGARDVEGKRFVVSGNKLYQLASTGVATELGTIPGTRRVSMTHNQIAGGNQLVIATGDNSYVWDTVAETLTATGIPLLFVDFINQLIVGVDVARRFWRYSGLADATAWNSLDNESAESSPDRLVGLIVSQGEVLLFGERTIEVWSNSPTDTTAFQRSTVIEKGCANGNTICRLDNTVFFVGNDLIPYRLNGYTPMPIASKAITGQLSQGDPSKLFAFTWEDRGYVVYYLTAQDGHTWGHDVTSGRWHRRESFGLDRWRLNTLFKWNGSWWGGDYSGGKLYQLEWGLVYEHDTIFPRSVRSGVMHNEGNRVFIHALRLVANTGGYTTPTVSNLAVEGDVPSGIVGDASTGEYTASGGVPGYSFAVTSGTFPAGLTLASDGTWSGTLTDAGVYNWTVTVTDGNGDTASVDDTATITLALAETILADIPILYWKLDETSGTTVTDYSGNNYHGTTTGSPDKTDAGIVLTELAQGVYYPGDVGGSVLDVGEDDGWAIEAIITRSGNGGAVWEHIAGQFRSPNFGYVNCLLALAGSSIPANQGKPYGAFTDTSTTAKGVMADTAVTNGERTILAVRRAPGSGSDTLDLFVNGALVGTLGVADTALGIASNGAKFLVGSDPDTAYFPSSYGFIGKIAHVSVYDTTLSDARLLAHAEAAGLA